jgi:D-alanine transaminase
LRELAYVNGDIMDLEEATIPILDRGFLFGDGIYEVIRIYQGVPFGLDRHLQRLQNSARSIMLNLPHTMGTFEDLILDLVEESGIKEGWVYMQVTRGVAPRAHAFPENVDPTLVMFVKALPEDSGGQAKAGASVVKIPDQRWLLCNIKSVSLLANVLAKEQATRMGAYECILHRPDGSVTEGASCNVFAVIDGVVRTHPADNLVLPGITRDYVLEICADEGIPFNESAFSVEDLKGASEIFLTGTVSEITPVVKVDNTIVGDGTPGPVTTRIASAYAALVAKALL